MTNAEVIVESEMGGGHALTHWCRCCGQPFAYHHDGHYNPEQLRPVDWVCRSCFPRWVSVIEQH